MSNLIITVISIALLSIVAITAILYLNATMNNAQPQVYANTMVEQAKQISAAWNVYANDHGGSFGLPNAGLGGGAQATVNFTEPDLVPNYLANWPIPPRDVAQVAAAWKDGRTSWYVASYSPVTGVGASANTAAQVLAWRLDNTDNAYQVCRQATKILNGPNAEPTPRVPPSSYLLFVPGRIADCFWSDTNNNGVFDSGETGATFVLRLY